eukprot:TRINITY_DN1178_c0_g2_i14.p1 TRINITY_DN1178_c0_g2~~TRINITY_DN1178_c0_g2_i14.p1  ORF type:complete len:4518 (+),score=1049.96 TRINITY_DN1178_c0_g2_i14:77-13630(+)
MQSALSATPRDSTDAIDAHLLSRRITHVATHIESAAATLLGVDRAILSHALSRMSSHRFVSQFASDVGVPSLFLSRVGDESHDVLLSLEPIAADASVTVVFSKLRPIDIDADRPLATQLQVTTFAGDSRVGDLDSVIRNSISPVFRSYASKIQTSRAVDSDTRSSIATIRKRLADLEVSLGQCSGSFLQSIRLAPHERVRELLNSNDAAVVADSAEFSSGETLNSLSETVKEWNNEIRSFVETVRSRKVGSSGSLTQEMVYWANVERNLQQLQAFTKERDTVFIINILKRGKRFQIVNSYEAETKLSEFSDKVTSVNQLIRGTPLELTTAEDIPQVLRGVELIWAHLKRPRSNAFEVGDYHGLMELVFKELISNFTRVVDKYQILSLPIGEFNTMQEQWMQLFKWVDETKSSVREVIREIAKKRGEQAKIQSLFENRALRERLESIAQFRRGHEELSTVMVRVFTSRGAAGDHQEAIKKLEEAYQLVHKIPTSCVDTTPDGKANWEGALSEYSAMVENIENSISSQLRNKLKLASSASEMLVVFSQFNELFRRSTIRQAINEYQRDLFEKVKADIKLLRDKFATPYGMTEASRLSLVYDVQPTVGSVIWAKQIEAQLDTYMKRVESVLGPEWEKHPEGMRLKQESDGFRKKLDTEAFITKWYRDASSRRVDIRGAIYQFQKKGPLYSIHVNFDMSVSSLVKEARQLAGLKIKIPPNVETLVADISVVYPFAVSLQESLKTYQVSNGLVTSEISMLMQGPRRAVQALIEKGCRMTWIDPQLEAHCDELCRNTSSFEDLVHEALGKTEEVGKLVQSLRTCALDKEALFKIVKEVQKTIDHLSLRPYSNMQEWVRAVDVEVEAALVVRLQESVQEWIGHFTGETNRAKAAQHSPMWADDVYEVIIKNQQLRVEPPIETARLKWSAILQLHIDRVCGLPRLQGSRYEQFHSVAGTDGTEALSYRNLISKIGVDLLTKCFGILDKTHRDFQRFCTNWLRYQNLWSLDFGQIQSLLGRDLEKWQNMLTDVNKARNTFDTSETMQSFGPLVVNYHQVQETVRNKYDFLQAELVKKFKEIVGEESSRVMATLRESRERLEKSKLVGGKFQDIISLLNNIKDYGNALGRWEVEAKLCMTSNRYLISIRWLSLPEKWVTNDQLGSELDSFREIFSRKKQALDEKVPELREIVQTETRVTRVRLEKFEGSWREARLNRGDLHPEAALKELEGFQRQQRDLEEACSQILKASQTLDGAPVSLNASQTFEEIEDLRRVWDVLRPVWAEIDGLKAKRIKSVSAREVRQKLEELETRMNGFAPSVRGYDGFVFAANCLKKWKSVNALIGDMHSESVRERHWAQIRKITGLPHSMDETTLGQMWAADLKGKEVDVRGVLTTAQGEMALEEFLKQLDVKWSSFEFVFTLYQQRVYVVKSWDDVFTSLTESLNNISSMKLSPYFKEFEKFAVEWEERLNKLRLLLDVWIDVQRRWSYLEGVFNGSADIKMLLPHETSRFRNIDGEFCDIMRKVVQKRRVLEVSGIENIQRSFERMAESLVKIQRSLVEYLERQRVSFPRFFFIGDEDLLDIIGNSKDPSRVQKHLRKMFAGLSKLDFSREGTSVLGFSSREDEHVTFSVPVELKEDTQIYAWLSAIEAAMKTSLSDHLVRAVQDMRLAYATDQLNTDALTQAVDTHIDQLVVLSSQIMWTADVERALLAGSADLLQFAMQRVLRFLEMLAQDVLKDLAPAQRKKREHLITEFVHQRDVIRQLIANGVSGVKDFEWLYYMRFVFTATLPQLSRLSIQMANANINYGYEYLGIAERLVQTPLTDRCYLTLTQAIHGRMGGSPFGPAGTGKTETVKALGSQLGRFVLVFNCDETFDFQAMGRIFLGLCQCGAWGCFDEFNRLEERIMSAVSQQIQTIQVALRDRLSKVELLGKQVLLNSEMGIFVTMNPGYAGRRNLPDNLKQLFRSVAMVKPDRELIAQVMLFSQGFQWAEMLASKIVPLFHLCQEQLSPQPHYDFGLRALKSVLVSAGNLQRRQTRDPSADSKQAEQLILMRSICETIVPKLLGDDILLLRSLMADVFPGMEIPQMEMRELQEEIEKICKTEHLIAQASWCTKLLQLAQIQEIHHGIMLVGPSGSGKTSAWRVLLQAMEKLDGQKAEHYVIDPKAITKEELYGVLDANTREWSDGLFTHVLRKIIDNVRGESGRRHWIVFDGDVDPEWVENLNSVLDDNKMMTLPNGERLALPANLRIVFEVQDLKYATLATVSRCGMVWFSSETVTPGMVLQQYLMRLVSEELSGGDDLEPMHNSTRKMELQQACARVLEPFFQEDGLVVQALREAHKFQHIMDFTWPRALVSLFGLLNKSIVSMAEYNSRHFDFPLRGEQVQSFLVKRLLGSIVWAFAGSGTLEMRNRFGQYVAFVSNTGLPSDGGSLIDYEVRLPEGTWAHLKTRVPVMEVETHKISSPDVVITTIDTVRHQDMIGAWLRDHKPLILCGPPGSGKTMTLQSTLSMWNDYELLVINFSSTTSPTLLMNTFESYCEYKKHPDGYVMRPKQASKWLVIFCDEINLPATDKYGTQRVIAFIRQLVEQGGFWRFPEMLWVRLERIQFVGACNPPSDPGRVPLSHRFLRHAPVVYVDFPSADSLRQIYGTFNRSLFRMMPSLRQFAEPFTDTMVGFYLESQKRFTPDVHPHYIYSPRELSRWIRALHEGIKSGDVGTLEGLLRLFAHEALRLFGDRLVSSDEREWTNRKLDEMILANFARVDALAIARPILFSDWLSRRYCSVDRNTFRDFVRARLKTFYEEELDVPLVLFDEVLEHVLRIDRVLHQPQGHMLLIGVSGAGKTVLSRFVAWVNGLSIYQIKVSKRYTGEDFDKDLREVLRRSGCKGEKICFIFDESNVLDSSFLERMNALLASGEVPGLFEGDEKSALGHLLRESAQREGLMSASDEELYKWFIGRVQTNLHVIFTMNPASSDFYDRSVSSPALFNRCVVDWFGNWSMDALYQVAQEFTSTLDLDSSAHSGSGLAANGSFRDAVIRSLVYVHNSIAEVNSQLLRKYGRCDYVSPRHFLDFIKHYVSLFMEKRTELEEQQLHLNIGLQKLKDTEQQIAELKGQLQKKKVELDQMSRLADEKLAQMIKNKQEAEKKQEEATVIQKHLEVQNVEIEREKRESQEQLANAEPALVEAQRAVGSIKKAQLDEIRSLGKPPNLVQLTLEAVCYLFTRKKETWDNIRSIIRKEDFISNILRFESTKMTEADRLAIEKYFALEEFNYDKVMNASKACGPLVNWLHAQIYYSRILENIEPLRRKIVMLEEASREQAVKHAELKQTIGDLEQRIAVYKDEYQRLIKDQQAIQEELSRVESKVTRSTSLLHNLQSERIRWDQESTSFQRQIATLPGDVVIAAGFCTYCGYLDQHHRTLVMQKWQDFLGDHGIPFKHDLSVVEYLSSPDERLVWTANSLPSDELCTENAIILNRFNRYPLVIDPSGQATEFILQSNAAKKIIKTSFLDESFMKSLESCLRFGYPLLVQDVERIDPILNPVLNKEIHKTGGRTLIRLGDQEIDFSPSFCIYMTTRDPTFCFSPDICSRVSFVNFTVTHSSLSSQCLNQVMKVERPDIEQKRADVYKLQGEFRVKLRKLEHSLLASLSASQGNILDDDHVIATLEQLKTEAAEIAVKSAEADSVLAQVNSVSATYKSFADSCSRVYFTLEELGIIHPLYQYSLGFFMNLFHRVLNTPATADQHGDAASRLFDLKNKLFVSIYQQVSRGLFHEDRLMFAFHLALIYLNGHEKEPDPLELAYILKGSETTPNTWMSLPSWMSESQKKQIAQVSVAVPPLRDIVAILQSQEAEIQALVHASSLEEWGFVIARETSPIINGFHRILLVKIFRPEFLCDAVEEFVGVVFGNARFLDVKSLNIMAAVQDDLSATTPMLLCAKPGYDPTTLVEAAAAQMGRELNTVAIGSPEGYDLAEKAINIASKNGFWALLKNIHLAPQWLSQLEKKLHALKPHPEFRIFLAMEVQGVAVPVTLLRSSRVFVFEQPSGIKAQLGRIFSSSVVATRSSRGPRERMRLHFLAAWLHSVLQQRLRFVPLGWSAAYELNENDLQCALEMIDHWVDEAAGARANVEIRRLPWAAMRTLLTDSIYGGRIDNDFDMRILTALVAHLFAPDAYSPTFALVRDARPSLRVPAGVSYDEFKHWVDDMPAFESPVFYGLDPTANTVMRTAHGDTLVRKILRIQTINDDDDDAPIAAAQQDGRNVDAHIPAWMAPIKSIALEWLSILPQEIADVTPASAAAAMDPMFRVFYRENNIARKLLSEVRNDLVAVAAVADGKERLTNRTRDLMNHLAKATVPTKWRVYAVDASLSATQWIHDFVRRVEQLVRITQSGAVHEAEIWIGGLFAAEAFITATRQVFARHFAWSLETLEMRVHIETPPVGAPAFKIRGLSMMGAAWNGTALTLSSQLNTPLPTCFLSWVPKDQQQLMQDSASSITLPFYLNPSRKHLLFSAVLPTSDADAALTWYQRGVAAVAWTLKQ